MQVVSVATATVLAAGRPSMVVISSVRLMRSMGTAHGLNALPLMCDVQALQTLMPQPYLGPVTPRMSRRTQSRRTLSATSTVTVLPLSLKVCFGMVLPRSIVVAQKVKLRPLRGDGGTGGT